MEMHIIFDSKYPMLYTWTPYLNYNIIYFFSLLMHDVIREDSIVLLIVIYFVLESNFVNIYQYMYFKYNITKIYFS